MRLSFFRRYSVLGLALDHLGDLLSEVLLLLLDAFALLKADGVHEGDLAAQLLGSVSDILLDSAGEHIAADKLLLQQAVLGVELVHLAHDDHSPSGPS